MAKQTTDSQGHPICDWCDRAVIDDFLRDGRGWIVHETCFDARRDAANAPEDFENACPCGNPDC